MRPRLERGFLCLGKCPLVAGSCRRLEWHSRGQGFDPPQLHHIKAEVTPSAILAQPPKSGIKTKPRSRHLILWVIAFSYPTTFSIHIMFPFPAYIYLSQGFVATKLFYPVCSQPSLLSESFGKDFCNGLSRSFSDIFKYFGQ